jgi:hypothetical protein
MAGQRGRPTSATSSSDPVDFQVPPRARSRGFIGFLARFDCTPGGMPPISAPFAVNNYDDQGLDFPATMALPALVTFQLII